MVEKYGGAKMSREKKQQGEEVEVRLLLTDKTWNEIAQVLEQVKRKDGAPGQLSVRMFIEALLYIARTGIPWRDLPSCFGRWEAVYMRFRRWEKSGVWYRLWQVLQQDKFKAAKQIFIDSTIVRAHQHAAGAQKKTADRRLKLLDVLGVDSPPKST